MGRRSRWSKSLDVWEGEMSGPAWDRWMKHLDSRRPGTQREYKFHLRLFLEYMGMDPQKLYETRRENLLDGEDDFAEQEIETRVKDLMSLMQRGELPWGKGQDRDKPYAPSTAVQTAKAVDSFLGSINKKYKLNLDRYELPQGNGTGRTGARPDMILEMWRQPGEAKLRNRGIITFQKDSGIRISDMCNISVGFYREMRRQVRFNDRDEPFLVFDPVRTIKEGIVARIHVGPEAVEDIDQYLKQRRRDAGDGEPLFAKWEKRRSGYRKDIDREDPWMDSNTVSQLFIRMGKKVEESGYSIGAHSLRKYHKVSLQRGGVPEKWIKLLQGKATSTYDVPEPEDLLKKYMGAYDSLRIKQKPPDQAIREQQSQIQGLTEKVMRLEKMLDASVLDTIMTGFAAMAKLETDPGKIEEYANQVKKAKQQIDEIYKSIPEPDSIS